MLRLAAMLAASAACSLATGAPAWPSAPVQILAPFAQGGVPVGYARIVSKQLSVELGQPFNIEPGPATGVSTAAQRLAGSVPDGLTLLLASYTHHGPAPELTQQTDFGGVGKVGHIPLFMAIRRASALSTVASLERSTLAPDVPSMAELGYPEFELPASFGVFAPKGTPEIVIARLHFEMTKILARPDVRQSLALIGVEVNPGAPAILARTQSTFLYQ